MALSYKRPSQSKDITVQSNYFMKAKPHKLIDSGFD